MAGWDFWKSDLLNRINGMFAFAILDIKSNNLVIARDRFGKKPLYYAEKSGELLFSSNLLALEKLPKDMVLTLMLHSDLKGV